MLAWTVEQIIALAPDAASARAARGVARPDQWPTLGRNDRALWGECRGSGGAPYQTGIDPGEPAFKCSCPSRKFPCKHALGLLLLAAGQPGAVPVGEPPAWVSEWLVRREQSARRKGSRAAETEADPEQQAKRAAAKDKRTAERQRKVETGLDELERWLCDLVRQGLAHAQKQPARYWDAMAARLVDAQAPGLARWLREMAGIPASGEGWSERLVTRLGLLQLLLEGYRRIDSLPEPLQADIRSVIGWTWQEVDLPGAAWQRDRWFVLGLRSYEEDRLRARRGWLWGRDSGRLALILDFAYQNQPLPAIAAPGTWLEAELGFFPSQYPLRASLRNSNPVEDRTMPPALADGAALLAAQAGALARQPWLEILPTTLAEIVPVRGEVDAWFLRDATAHLLPCHPGFADPWRLLALSGGWPLTVFGEWNGSQFWPLSAWIDERFTAF